MEPQAQSYHPSPRANHSLQMGRCDSGGSTTALTQPPRPCTDATTTRVGLTKTRMAHCQRFGSFDSVSGCFWILLLFLMGWLSGTMGKTIAWVVPLASRSCPCGVMVSPYRGRSRLMTATTTTRLDDAFPNRERNNNVINNHDQPRNPKTGSASATVPSAWRDHHHHGASTSRTVLYQKVVRPPLTLLQDHVRTTAQSNHVFWASLVDYLQTDHTLPSTLPMVYNQQLPPEQHIDHDLDHSEPNPNDTTTKTLFSNTPWIVKWSSPLSPDPTQTTLYVEVVAIYTDHVVGQQSLQQQQPSSPLAMVVVYKDNKTRNDISRRVGNNVPLIPPMLQNLFVASEQQICKALDRGLDDWMAGRIPLSMTTTTTTMTKSSSSITAGGTANKPPSLQEAQLDMISELLDDNEEQDVVDEEKEEEERGPPFMTSTTYTHSRVANHNNNNNNNNFIKKNFIDADVVVDSQSRDTKHVPSSPTQQQQQQRQEAAWASMQVPVLDEVATTSVPISGFDFAIQAARQVAVNNKQKKEQQQQQQTQQATESHPSSPRSASNSSPATIASSSSLSSSSSSSSPPPFDFAVQAALEAVRHKRRACRRPGSVPDASRAKDTLYVGDDDEKEEEEKVVVDRENHSIIEMVNSKEWRKIGPMDEQSDRTDEQSSARQESEIDIRSIRPPMLDPLTLQQERPRAFMQTISRPQDFQRRTAATTTKKNKKMTRSDTKNDIAISSSSGSDLRKAALNDGSDTELRSQPAINRKNSQGIDNTTQPATPTTKRRGRPRKNPIEATTMKTLLSAPTSPPSRSDYSTVDSAQSSGSETLASSVEVEAIRDAKVSSKLHKTIVNDDVDKASNPQEPSDWRNIPMRKEDWEIFQSTQEALDQIEAVGKDMTPEELLHDVLQFGNEQEQSQSTGHGFVSGAFEKAKDLLRDQRKKREQRIRENIVKQVTTEKLKHFTPDILDPREQTKPKQDAIQHMEEKNDAKPLSIEEELRRMFAAGERIADNRISTATGGQDQDDEMVDELIAQDKIISGHTQILDDELSELEVRINRSPGEEADGPVKNALLDIFSGPEVYNPNMDPTTAVNWPGAIPGTRQVRLPRELDEAVKQARFAVEVLMNLREEESMDSDGAPVTRYFVGERPLNATQVQNLRTVADEAVTIGLIDDPLQRMQEESRLQLLLDELWSQPEERFREIASNYKDLLLSDNFVLLINKRLNQMADRDVDALRRNDESLEEGNSRERELLGHLVSYAQLLLKEARALGAELEAQQLEVIRSICKVAMDPSHQTEEETAMALTDAVRDMRPLLDDSFVAYLKYAVAEEEGRLSRAGLVDDQDHNQWLFVLKIVQQGVYTELAKGINRYLEHIWYVLRMETPFERRQLLKKLIDVMPTLDVRPFVQVVENIVASLGEGARGQFDGVSELGAMTNKILQLHRDMKDLLPPERIASMSRDADEWVAERKKRLIEQRKISKQRLRAASEIDDSGATFGDRGELERFD